MLFNSFSFAYFFAILFPTYWALARWKGAQNLLLLAAGYYFYANWEPRFLILLIASTLMDYACGLGVARITTPWKRKAFVALSMALNLGMLGYFKYWNFFAGSLQEALSRSGLDVPLGQLEVILPIGISFYTFQSMAYVIDVYRGDIKPTRNVIEFATFVSFFPHLVAGPIMRPTTLLPQVANRRRFDVNQLYQGAYLIFWGLTKKVVVADNLAVMVNDLFAQSATINGGLALLAVYAFAFQIYCDFSGYTDAARGVAKCLGFELSLNFNLPYFATSPKDFWSRWHISLSQWLRDYLYIPLGGSRGDRAIWAGNALLALIAGAMGAGMFVALGSNPKIAGLVAEHSWVPAAAGGGLVVAMILLLGLRGRSVMTYRNLMLTMIIGGLWHGASWTFVAWGAYQGLILVGHRLAEPWLAKINPTDPIDAFCWKAVRVVVTFHLVCLGWLLFRAESLGQAYAMLDAIVNRFAIPASSYILPIALAILPLAIMESAQAASGRLDVVERSPWYVRSLVYTACFYLFVLAGEFGGKQFIYFQF